MEISFHLVSPELLIILSVIVIVLLAMSAFISGSEVAFFSLKPVEMDELKEQNDKKSQRILELLNNSEHLLAVILIMNNFVNVAVIILINYGMQVITIPSPVLDFLFRTVIITFVLLLFGEIMPKIYATQNALKFARMAAPVYPFFLKLLKPFSTILVGSTNIVNKRISKHRNDNISVSELSQALELTGNDLDEDKDILEGIVKFGSTSVAEVMTPRLNMVDVNIETIYTDLISKITEFGYSRMPVYSGTHDDVEGILYIKDLLTHLNKPENFQWQSLIRPAYFVPETKKIDDLFEEFQKNKIHMAIVVDEFGGTSGIITLEDILEEIVGDISDEYDNDEKDYQKIDNNTYIFEAQILLKDFFRITEIDEEEFSQISADADSLAGIILELKGEIPHEKEKIEFKNYSFEILNADDRKIEKVKFHINE